MSTENRQLIESIRSIAGTQLTDRVSVIPCTVNSVDLPSRTCDCTPIGGTSITDLPGVQLQAESNDGLLIVPSIGSTVYVIYSERNIALVIGWSDVDQIIQIASTGEEISLGLSKIQLINGNSTLEVDGSVINFNGGNLGGLTKIVNLVSKLNNLENLLNSLIQDYNFHTHSGVTTGAGVSGPILVQQAGSITPTVRADIEDTTVNH